MQQAITDVMEMFDLVLVPFADWLIHLPLPRMRRYRAAQHGARRGDLRHHRGTADVAVRTEATCCRCCCRPGLRGRQRRHDDRQLRDEVITLFLAGHETTANALIWTWALLARHPEAEQHLHAEIDAVLGERPPSADDVTRACHTPAPSLAESMRLYPPAWTMGRRALVDYHWAGHDIPPAR